VTYPRILCDESQVNRSGKPKAVSHGSRVVSSARRSALKTSVAEIAVASASPAANPARRRRDPDRVAL